MAVMCISTTIKMTILFHHFSTKMSTIVLPKQNQVSKDDSHPGRALTVNLACVVVLDEVFVAAALVGALGVVADLGANAKLEALISVCHTHRTETVT